MYNGQHGLLYCLCNSPWLPYRMWALHTPFIVDGFPTEHYSQKSIQQLSLSISATNLYKAFEILCIERYVHKAPDQVMQCHNTIHEFSASKYWRVFCMSWPHGREATLYKRLNAFWRFPLYQCTKTVLCFQTGNTVWIGDNPYTWSSMHYDQMHCHHVQANTLAAHLSGIGYMHRYCTWQTRLTRQARLTVYTQRDMLTHKAESHVHRVVLNSIAAQGSFESQCTKKRYTPRRIQQDVSGHPHWIDPSKRSMELTSRKASADYIYVSHVNMHQKRQLANEFTHETFFFPIALFLPVVSLDEPALEDPSFHLSGHASLANFFSPETRVPKYCLI